MKTGSLENQMVLINIEREDYVLLSRHIEAQLKAPIYIRKCSWNEGEK